MYKLSVMSYNLKDDFAKLEEDQKSLVIAFCAAAQHIHDRLLKKTPKISESFRQMVERYQSSEINGYEQASSQIAGEAIAELTRIAPDANQHREKLLQAIKFGISKIYSEDKFSNTGSQKRGVLAAEYKKDVLKSLFEAALTYKLLPEEYIRVKMAEFDFIQKPQTRPTSNHG